MRYFIFKKKELSFFRDVIGPGTHGKVRLATKKMKWLRGFKDYKLACKRITIASCAPGTGQTQDRVKALDDDKEHILNELKLLDLEHENLVTRLWVNKFYSEKNMV